MLNTKCYKYKYHMSIYGVRSHYLQDILYSQSDKMYNSITLIVQFHCPTCFEPLIWVHLQGLITHYSHQLVQLFT